MGLLLDMGLHLLQLDWFGSDWCRCEINGKRWFPLPLVCAISLKTCWEVGRFAEAIEQRVFGWEKTMSSRGLSMLFPQPRWYTWSILESHWGWEGPAHLRAPMPLDYSGMAPFHGRNVVLWGYHTWSTRDWIWLTWNFDVHPSDIKNIVEPIILTGDIPPKLGYNMVMACYGMFSHT